MRVVEREIASAFIFSKDGYLLLGQNSQGGVYKDYWLIPGGGIEAGETPLQAVRREVLEEVGLDITSEQAVLIGNTQTGESEKLLKETGEVVLVKMRFHHFRVDMSHNASDMALAENDGFCKACWNKGDELKDKQLATGLTEVLADLGYTIHND